MLKTVFDSLPTDQSGSVSWIHIGDPHITGAGVQNAIDLGRIVDEINEVFAHGGVDFVFVPGDIADDGSVAAYEVFRSHLDRLKLPWCAIVGDHDVHEESFDNFRKCICPELYGAFVIGSYRFLRLNAFSLPKPDSFVVDEDQLAWLGKELKSCEENKLKGVIFLHCYPSDLKKGGEELRNLLQQYPVLLVDMGHTHYNEISNDGTLLYSATRSTGQIEEGPVGYSLTILDNDTVSWHFVALGTPSLVAITQPADKRLLTSRTSAISENSPLHVRARVWSRFPLEVVEAQAGEEKVTLGLERGAVWIADVASGESERRERELSVTAKSREGDACTSAIRFWIGSPPTRQYAPRDQDNAIGAWKERDLLGTQLGPNKNGRKW